MPDRRLPLLYPVAESAAAGQGEMKTEFAQPGTFPKLGPIGRAVRLLIGVLILWMVVPPFVQHWEGYTQLREGWETPRGTWYIGVLIAVYLLPITVDRLFTVNWDWRSQAAWGALAAALVGFDLAYYGALWAPPLGWFLLLTTVLVLGAIGLAFVVQAAAATPG
jgi:hypothetical protein